MPTNAVSIEPDLRSIKDVLMREQRRIVLEILHYAPPITRCDVQYNTLLEERAAINREMARLEHMMQASQPSPDDAQALRDYIAHAAFLDGDAKQRLLTLLQAGEPRS